MIIGLPVILAEQDVYSDSFTKFSVALLEDYDFEQSLNFAREMQKEAEADILLRPHASEIYRQACLYVYEVQARLQKTGDDLNVFCATQKISEAGAIESVIQNLEDQRLIVQKKGSIIVICGTKNDVKGKITTMTTELVRRTDELNKILLAQAAAAATKT